MRFSILTVMAFASVCLAQSITPDSGYSGPECLSDAEAEMLATSWLDLFSTASAYTLDDAAKIAAQDVHWVDPTFDVDTYTIKGLYDDATAVDPLLKSADYYSLNTFHSCNQIATHWNGCAVPSANATNCTSEIVWQGTDILVVDLDTRLIIYANSTGDWTVYAAQFGIKIDIP